MSLYIEHFGLSELPFRITPAVQFFYRGCIRGETLDALKYAINNDEGIMAVIGEVGTGKSMLCRMLMAGFSDKAQLVYIANPTFTDQEIIYHISDELGLDVAREHRLVARDLQHQLLKLHNENKRIIVCIDEAQAMPDASLEQIRLLSNLETSTKKIVQIVMFGQPEFAQKLEQRHMRQLRERITSTFYLRKLSADETHEYISHRLRSASSEAKEEIFTPAAVAMIAKVSQGISRRINILCDKAMLAAFADSSPNITLAHAKRAARDARYRHMEEDQLEAEHQSHYRKTAIAGAIVLCAIIAIAYQTWIASPPAAVAAQPAATTPAPATTTVTIVAPEPTALATIAAPEPTATTPATIAAPEPTVTAPATIAVPEPTAAQPVATVAPKPAATTQAPTAAAVAVLSKQVTSIDNPRWQGYPPTSYLRQRLNATQTLFSLLDQIADPGQYTARILSVPRERTIELERYLRDLARFYTIRNVLIYPAVAENQELFVITYGTFPSEFQAELFIHELPSFFRTNKPFVQALAVSQLEAGSYW